MNREASDSQVDLTGQVALVTGGGGGLGRAFARIRAQDNEEELVRRAEEIQRDDLHTVTLRT